MYACEERSGAPPREKIAMRKSMLPENIPPNPAIKKNVLTNSSTLCVVAPPRENLLSKKLIRPPPLNALRLSSFALRSAKHKAVA